MHIPIHYVYLRNYYSKTQISYHTNNDESVTVAYRVKLEIVNRSSNISQFYFDTFQQFHIKNNKKQ